MSRIHQRPTRLKRRRRTRLPDRRQGSVLVEAAIVLPVAMLLLFGILEYGRLLLARNALEFAAREGARYAVVRADDGLTVTQDIVDHVHARLGVVGNQLQSLSVQVFKADSSDGSNIGVWQDAAFGESIAVRINGDYQPVTGGLLFMPGTIPMQSMTMMDSEAN